MKFLLTSSGITNASIEGALVDLLGKPIAASSALVVPTGVRPFPGGLSHVYRFITGASGGSMCGLGWKSVGELELTALPSIKEEVWTRTVGCRDLGAGIRDRRRDRHQGGRRHRRSHLRGELEAVYP
jgi:dipeptidase E